ncbi:MAG: low affinity iron permease family protein [Nocardiopsaceae bacterium]|nr:low affinity iron permease family protein [Nocardiopsaceae bacterium]
MAEFGPLEETSRSFISRWLSRLDRYASRPLTAMIIISGVGIWIVISVAVGFPSRWEIVFQSLVAALTLAMVFVIQHTQARQQRATQRKLDEILLAMPTADNSLLALEHASDQELRDAGHQHRKARRAAVEEGLGAGETSPVPAEQGRSDGGEGWRVQSGQG